MSLLSLALGAVLGALAAALAAVLWVVGRLLPAARATARAEAVRELELRLQGEAQAKAREDLAGERQELEQARETLREGEARLRKREEGAYARLDALEERERQANEREAKLRGEEAELSARQAEVGQLKERQTRELERVAELRREEAEHLLLDRIERDMEEEVERAIKRKAGELRAEADRQARDAVVTALQRTALSHAQEVLATSVPLPSDELKGALVGRDGRNARTFEQQTGVDLLIDDTPGVVVVSAFDPVRREIARRALVRLLAEGRIHPPRIEAVVAESRQEIEETVRQLGEDAADRAGVQLPARLLELLGRLEFCTSEGQNVRLHSLEVAHLAALMAGELGLDPEPARRAGLLHDIGKAVDHTTGGDHSSVGAEQARRVGEDQTVVEAIAAHHGDAELDEVGSPYAVLVELANRLSAERPGARRSQIELAIRRRETLEELALQQPGVERAYAVQAGREVRVIVDASKVSDKSAARLARDVARVLEESAPGVGQTKVVVVREVRHEAETA